MPGMVRGLPEMPAEARSHRALSALVKSLDLTLRIPIGGFYEEEQRLLERQLSHSLPVRSRRWAQMVREYLHRLRDQHPSGDGKC